MGSILFACRMSQSTTVDQTSHQIQSVVGDSGFLITQPLRHRALDGAHDCRRAGFFPLRHHVQYGPADRQTKLMIKLNLFMRLHTHSDKIFTQEY
ncbi:hypothetical protein A8A12_07190 [Serratia marcescens]|nr:hypothetical protein A8A12_07190 [Serratia marcescens]